MLEARLTLIGAPTNMMVQLTLFWKAKTYRMEKGGHQEAISINFFGRCSKRGTETLCLLDGLCFALCLRKGLTACAFSIRTFPPTQTSQGSRLLSVASTPAFVYNRQSLTCGALT